MRVVKQKIALFLAEGCKVLKEQYLNVTTKVGYDMNKSLEYDYKKAECQKRVKRHEGRE